MECHLPHAFVCVCVCTYVFRAYKYIVCTHVLYFCVANERRISRTVVFYYMLWLTACNIMIRRFMALFMVGLRCFLIAIYIRCYVCVEIYIQCVRCKGIYLHKTTFLGVWYLQFAEFYFFVGFLSPLLIQHGCKILTHNLSICLN